MHNPGKRRFDRSAMRHPQLDVQRAGVWFRRTVRACAGQTVLSITARCQAVGRSRFAQQTLIDPLLFPVTGLEMRAQYAQIDQGKFTPDQARQQRCEAFAADVRQAVPHRGEDRRFHQRQRHRRGDAENFPLVDQIVAAVGVARIDADLLLAAEHQHRRPRNDQWPQRQQLFVLQRIDRVISLNRRQNVERIASGMVQQRRAGHRQVGNAPRADQIAKIDHALQLPLALRIALPDRVVVGDVHVNGLYRQLVHQRLQMPLGLFGHFGDQRALPVIFNHRQQMRDQRIRVAGVPLKGALKARMIESGQRQVHFAAEPAETGHHGSGQMIEMCKRLALDVFEQAYVHRLPVDFQ
ncbi:hypothetical protein D3C84_624200 [compost metagenome]